MATKGRGREGEKVSLTVHQKGRQCVHPPLISRQIESYLERENEAQAEGKTCPCPGGRAALHQRRTSAENPDKHDACRK